MKKETYSIKEISKITGINAHTIRYYESIFLIKNVERDSAGRRVFNDENIRWIEFIKKGKATGMSIKKLIEYAELLGKGDSSSYERREILKEHLEKVKNEIEKLNEMKEYIEFKIENYDKTIKDLSLEKNESIVEDKNV